MTGKPTETQGLLERARGGDHSTFGELFQRHRKRLHHRHLGAEKQAVIYEVPLLPVDSSATFVSGVIAGREPSPS